MKITNEQAVRGPTAMIRRGRREDHAARRTYRTFTDRQRGRAGKIPPGEPRSGRRCSWGPWTSPCQRHPARLKLPMLSDEIIRSNPASIIREKGIGELIRLMLIGGNQPTGQGFDDAAKANFMLPGRSRRIAAAGLSESETTSHEGQTAATRIRSGGELPPAG